MRQATKILLIGAALGGVVVWVYLKNKREKSYRDPEKITGREISYDYKKSKPKAYYIFGNMMYEVPQR